MTPMVELAYDIEQLYIEGYTPKMISRELGCSLELVYEWLEGESLQLDEEPSPEEWAAAFPDDTFENWVEAVDKSAV